MIEITCKVLVGMKWTMVTAEQHAGENYETDLEPGALALVVTPGLALELLGRQELLVGARLVVEGEEERLGVQLGVGGGVVQRLVLDGGEAGGDAATELPHARRHVLPLPVLRRGCRPPACASSHAFWLPLPGSEGNNPPYAWCGTSQLPSWAIPCQR